MKKYLFSFLIIYISTFGQPRDKFPAFIPIVPFETQVISFPRSDGDFSVYFTYKIPYRLLVFERQGESFLANFRIIIEISDKEGILVNRDIKDNKISVSNFESTNSPGLLLQDFLSFSLKRDDYKILAIISDMNSSGDRPLKPIELNLVEDENKVVLHPLAVKSEEYNCNGLNSLILSNSGGHIPFSLDEFNLIIPVIDTSLTELGVTLENNGELISTDTLNESYIEQFGINKCDDKILLTKSTENIPTRNFIIRNINKKLNEGDLTLTFRNESKNIDEKIDMKVVWFNKPMSLLNPEKAIEFLSFIEQDSVVDELLSADEEDYPKVLQNYWKTFDPTPETSFNEIMFEYYSRIDYAMNEFNSITNNNGAKTDRGVVYIRYGQPDKIDRTSTSQGEVIEIWTYSNSQRKFTFIDKIGTGNFTLTEN